MTRRTRFSGRAAHVTRSHRQDCLYDTEIEALYNSSEGKISRREYLSRRQKADIKAQFSMYLGDPVDSRFSRRTCACGSNIKFLPDGKAVCSNSHCSTVFNDGGNTFDDEERSLIKFTHIYADGKQVPAPPPRKMYDRKDRGFFRAIKA